MLKLDKVSNLFIWEKKYIYKNELQNEYIHK